MANIKTKTLSDGAKAYLVRWDDPAGKECSKQFRRWEDAKNFKTTIEGELLRGTYVDPKAGKVTFRKYFTDTYLPGLQQRQQSIDRVISIFELHVLPEIGSMRIGAIRRGELQRLINKLVVKSIGAPRGEDEKPRVLAAGYVVNIGLIVAGVFNAAVVDGIIPVSPFKKINFPEVPDHEVIIPTTEQVLQIADKIRPRMRNMIIVAAGTGLRCGELRGLSVDHVDFLRKTIKVRQQMLRQPKGPPYLGPPKTKAGSRDIPVANVVIEAIADQLANHGAGPQKIIFTNRYGKWLSPQSASDAIRGVLDELGFPRGIAWHLLRHYYASMLIHANLSVKVIQARLGHATAAETWDTYGHLWPDDDEGSRDAVEQWLGGSVAGPSRGLRSVAGP